MNTVQEMIADTNIVLEKVAAAQLGIPAGVTDPILVKVEGALESALGHLYRHPTVAPAASTVVAPVVVEKTPAGLAVAASVVVALALLMSMVCFFGSGCAGLSKLVDPPLPGTTAAAPLVAFTNGNAYLLGHIVTSNQVYTAALDATRGAVALTLNEAPGATNYLADAQAVFQSAATGGTFNQAALTASLNAIPIKAAGEQALLDSVANTALSLAGTYAAPLINKDANSAPYVEAALHGIADGL